MIHTSLNERSIEHAGIIASVIYFFRLAQRCKMYYFLKIRFLIYWLSLPNFFINRVTKQIHQQYFLCIHLKELPLYEFAKFNFLCVSVPFKDRK